MTSKDAGERGRATARSAPRIHVALTVRRGKASRDLAVDTLPFTIGRRGADLALADPAVSRAHCRLEQEGAQVVLVDLDSANGTWCDDERVQRLTLSKGASFRVGHTTVEVATLEITMPPPEDPLVGRQVGGYEIRGVLGRGGASTVYLARQTRLARDVALKVVDTEDTSPEELAAFEREARAAAALDDPRLVRVFDIGEAEGLHYLAMELVSGGSVAARLSAHGPLSWQEAVTLAIDVAGALAVAHARGFVHGDVKPGNVLVTETGHAKLADLGLVQTRDETDRRLAGSLAFIAPEKLLRRPTDGRADLYSLGCTLYMMLTGRRIFEGAAAEIARQHVREPPPSLEVSGMPRALADLVTDLLAKDPAARPQHAGDVAAALQRLLEAPMAGAPPRRRARRRAAGRGGGVLLLYALLYLVMLGGIAALGLWLAGRL